jgi:hypothetical protein
LRPGGLRYKSTIRGKAIEWYNEDDGPEDNSLMDTNQSGDIYQKDTDGPKRLEDWKDTICSEEVQADWLLEQGDWGTKGW